MKWIKHDTDANQDDKLQNVLLDYGLEGYGLYWYCIELIAGKVDKDNVTFELKHDARIIAKNTGSTPQKTEEMMRYFVKIGLFENAAGIITCMKLAKRLDKSMTSNPEMRGIISNLKGDNHDGVMTVSVKPMQDKIRLDKNRVKDTCHNSSELSRVPTSEIITLFAKHLPSLPKPKKITAARQKVLKSRHINDLSSDINRWDKYFEYIATNCKWITSGEYNVDFDYVIRESTFVKVIEGAKDDKEKGVRR